MECKEIREMTGLSQQKFGDMYGIPASTIRKWERGANEPPEYLLRLLERVVKEDFNKAE